LYNSAFESQAFGGCASFEGEFDSSADFMELMIIALVGSNTMLLRVGFKKGCVVSCVYSNSVVCGSVKVLVNVTR